MKNRYYIFLLMIVMLSSCGKIIIEDLPPNDFFFQLTRNGQPLSEAEMHNLKMFYMSGNTRVYEEPDENITYRQFVNLIYDPFLDSQAVRQNYYVHMKSKYINTWYIEFENQDIDTLYVETKEISRSQGKKDDCYCIRPFTVVKFNGKDVEKHPTLKLNGKPIYVLEK